jgi:hypothetical protein
MNISSISSSSSSSSIVPHASVRTGSGAEAACEAAWDRVNFSLFREVSADSFVLEKGRRFKALERGTRRQRRRREEDMEEKGERGRGYEGRRQRKRQSGGTQG